MGSPCTIPHREVHRPGERLLPQPGRRSIPGPSCPPFSAFFSGLPLANLGCRGLCFLLATGTGREQIEQHRVPFAFQL